MNYEQSHSQVAKKAPLHDLPDQQRADDELFILHKAVETSGEVLFLTDRQGIITYINPQFTRLYGYKAEDVVGKSTPRILKSGKMAPHDYELFWERLLAKETVWCEMVNRCQDGRLVTIEGSANPILDEHGDILGFLAIQHDITQRKVVEEDIRQRNKELAALNAVAALVNQTLDLDQILHSALDEVLRLKILGEQMYGMLFLFDEAHQTLQLVAQRGAPEDHPCLKRPIKMGECLCGLAAQQGEMVISHNSTADERHTRHWPRMYPHKDICIPVKARGKTLGVMEIRLPGNYPVAGNDVELLVSVADQIGVAIENAQLRDLRERVVIEERERIARELHDGLSQLLGYVNAKAMAARLLLQKRQVKAADQLLLQLEEAARELFVDVREAILGLRMAGQSGAGLAANLNDFIAHFSQLSGLAVDLSIAPEVYQISLKTETEYQLMRIVQEALNNVRKHASSSRTWVNVNYSNNLLELIIRDDGIGFDPQIPPIDNGGHLGLNTMRERAASIGAELQIESKPQSGVQVQVRLAVPTERSQ